MDYKKIINQLQVIEDINDLYNFAKDNNISDLEFLKKTWEFLKEKIVRPATGSVKLAFKPVGEAIKGRTQYEIEQAGQRLAQQIYPQGFQPQVQPVVVQQQGFDISKYLPYIAIATLIILLIKQKK